MIVPALPVLLFGSLFQPLTILLSLPPTLGGLIVFTLLSLAFVPSLFTTMDDLSRLAGPSGPAAGEPGRRRDEAGGRDEE